MAQERAEDGEAVRVGPPLFSRGATPLEPRGLLKYKLIEVVTEHLLFDIVT